MLVQVRFYDCKMGLCIKKCIEFSLHNFRNRKIKWVNDIFWQNRCVQDFYKEFDKFCFSSQMYLLIFLNVNALFAVAFGIKIILEFNYIAYDDPALVIIFCVIWIVGYVCSTVLSFICMKLKVYHLKEQAKGRAKL